MESANLEMWLLNQVPVVTVLGIVVFALFKLYKNASSEKTDLIKEFIKLVSVWDTRSDNYQREKDRLLESSNSLNVKIEQSVSANFDKTNQILTHHKELLTSCLAEIASIKAKQAEENADGRLLQERLFKFLEKEKEK